MKDTQVTDHSTNNKENTALILIGLREKLAEMDAKLAAIQKERASRSQEISLLQNEINKISLSANDIDKQNDK